jgi:hypothetical protein
MASVLDELIERIVIAQTSFRRACGQIMMMNRVISDMQKRYELAMKQHARAFRYSQRVRIAVLEGVRNMYYEYARQKADLILHLRDQIQLEQEYMVAHENDTDIGDEYHDYGDEYDLSDSELDYSDIDFSDYEDENENEVDSEPNFYFETVQTESANTEERKIEKIDNEKDLNGTEISIDSAFLDESFVEDESFSL